MSILIKNKTIYSQLAKMTWDYLAKKRYTRFFFVLLVYPEHIGGFVHSALKGVIDLIFKIFVTQNCFVIPKNHLIDDEQKFTFAKLKLLNVKETQKTPFH